jgi:hypothetical protein
MIVPMTQDEKDICLYLKSWPGQFVALIQIARRAGGKRRFHKDPGWAVPILKQLVERGIVEADATGHYCLKKEDKRKKAPQAWVSPQMRSILDQSGKTFDIQVDAKELEDFSKGETPTPDSNVKEGEDSL